MLQPPAPFAQLPPTPVLPDCMQPPTPTGAKPADQTQPQYGRMLDDGIPYRGPPVMLRDGEFDAATRVSSEIVSRTFDTNDPKQNHDYEQLVQRVINDNGIIRVFRERWAQKKSGEWTMLIYVTAEFNFRELDASKPRGRQLLNDASLSQQRVEANRGQVY